MPRCLILGLCVSHWGKLLWMKWENHKTFERDLKKTKGLVFFSMNAGLLIIIHIMMFYLLLPNTILNFVLWNQAQRLVLFGFSPSSFYFFFSLFNVLFYWYCTVFIKTCCLYLVSNIALTSQIHSNESLPFSFKKRFSQSLLVICWTNDVLHFQLYELGCILVFLRFVFYLFKIIA